MLNIFSRILIFFLAVSFFCNYFFVPLSIAQNNLFMNYNFGMLKSDALKLPLAKNGTGEYKDSIILPEIDYVGYKWAVRLDFTDEKLIRVSLMSGYSKERDEAINDELQKTGFSLLAILSDTKRLDCIVVLKTEGQKILQKKIDEMQTKSPLPKRLSFAWFDTSKVSKNIKQRVQNLSQFTQVISADTREVEVTFIGDGKIMSHMFVDFTLPVLEYQEAMIKK